MPSVEGCIHGGLVGRALTGLGCIAIDHPGTDDAPGAGLGGIAGGGKGLTGGPDSEGTLLERLFIDDANAQGKLSIRGVDIGGGIDTTLRVLEGANSGHAGRGGLGGVAIVGKQEEQLAGSEIGEIAGISGIDGGIDQNPSRTNIIDGAVVLERGLDENSLANAGAGG